MRPLSVAGLSLLAATGVAAVPSALPDLLAAPTSALAWWEAVGTADATVAVVQGLAVLGFAYVAAVATLVTLADALHLRTVRRLVLRLATPQLRRALTVTVVAGAVAVPTPAIAEESMIVITDVGPTDTSTETEPFVLTDLGPVETSAPDTDAPLVSTASVRDSFRPQITTAAPDAWLVETGDHLWGIAEAVLADQLGAAPSEAETAHYWGALISANAAEVDDPDLIFPGQVLTLPPVPTAGS